MSASIEKSLYIGILKTRFDLFDDVKLRLKNGNVIEGEIAEIGDCYICLKTSNGYKEVHVDNIDDYVA